jgi:hypothetical protein
MSKLTDEQLRNMAKWLPHHIEQQMATEILALRTELEKAREKVNEQARMNGMGAERELRLVAQRDAANALLRECVRWVAPKAANDLYARITKHLAQP